MVEEFLHTGKRNAIPSQQLVKLAKFKSTRELQKQIEFERKNGAVILSTAENGGGYFLPENTAEVAEFVRTVTARGKHTIETTASAREFLKHCEEREQWLIEADGEKFINQ